MEGNCKDSATSMIGSCENRLILKLIVLNCTFSYWFFVSYKNELMP